MSLPPKMEQVPYLDIAICNKHASRYIAILRYIVILQAGPNRSLFGPTIMLGALSRPLLKACDLAHFSTAAVFNGAHQHLHPRWPLLPPRLSPLQINTP